MNKNEEFIQTLKDYLEFEHILYIAILEEQLNIELNSLNKKMSFIQRYRLLYLEKFYDYLNLTYENLRQTTFVLTEPIEVCYSNNLCETTLAKHTYISI